MFLLYNLLILVLSPAIALYFIWRIVGSGKSRQSWRQQLGFLPESVRRRSGRPRLWVQAVSVGETVASVPIFRELRALLPDAEMIVSTTTTTGQEMAGKSISEADHVIYYPIDLLPAVSRAISIVKPDVFVSVESEIWPNFLNALRRKKIPAVMVNGIVSDKTYRQAMKVRPFYRWALSNVDSQMLAEAILRLAGDPELRRVMGEKGRELALRNFTADTMSRSIEDLYEAITNKNGRGSGDNNGSN
jgi:3-deoxy-D-manno-octulosonic-acid transferase